MQIKINQAQPYFHFFFSYFELYVKIQVVLKKKSKNTGYYGYQIHYKIDFLNSCDI